MISFFIGKIILWLYGSGYSDQVEPIFVALSAVELLFISVMIIINVVEKVQNDLEKKNMKEKKK